MDLLVLTECVLNGHVTHVTHDVTWPWKVKVVTSIR